MKKLLLTMILSLCFFMCSAHAATLTVTKVADENDNSCNADCSLREAIVAAVSGNNINRVFNVGG